MKSYSRLNLTEVILTLLREGLLDSLPSDNDASSSSSAEISSSLSSDDSDDPFST